MGLENNIDNLTAAFNDRVATIRVKGRGSFKTSPPMKQFITQSIETFKADEFLLDLRDCTGMDSTFMGIIAGVSCSIKKNKCISFKIINLSEKNKKLLTTLGVDRVVEFSELPNEASEASLQQNTITLNPSHISKQNYAETTLNAHQTLVDINPENHEKFKSVLELLQEDVDQLKIYPE